mgnify:CR=1 FL=1
MDFYIKGGGKGGYARKAMAVTVHPEHPANNYGRRGASIIVPGLGYMDGSELKDHIDQVNGNNPGRGLKVEDVEKAQERKIKGTDRPLSVKELRQLGLKPGEKKKIKDAAEKLRRPK